jgi:hypothetical protein
MSRGRFLNAAALVRSGAGAVTLLKHSANGRVTEAVDLVGADRALRVQAASIARATGRSREDVKRSLMSATVEGMPAAFARKGRDCFRAELHGATHLALTLTPYERQRAIDAFEAEFPGLREFMGKAPLSQLRNLGGEVIK